MNILYHHRTLGDGAEGIHVASIVDAFRTLGHDVKVASLVGEKTVGSRSRIQMVQQLRKWMPQCFYEAMEMGYNLAGYRLLTHQANGWKPAFLYERYTLFNLSGLMAARHFGIPLVVEVNSPLAYERAEYDRLALKRWAQAFERFVLFRADLVLTVSTPLKEYIAEQGVPPDHIAVLPNGTDPTLFRPELTGREEVRQSLDIPPTATVVGFVGILRPWHGVELLLDAVSQIAAPPESVYLIIVGDGPSQADLERLAQEKGLAGKVVFTGRVPHREVSRYLAAFDIAVSPRATFYASPMKVLEYMATGIPVIAPRTPNLQDIISDGVTGILFNAEDLGDLAASLTLLLNDRALRHRLGQNARASVVAGRTWLHNAARVLELVQGLPKWN